MLNNYVESPGKEIHKLESIYWKNHCFFFVVLLKKLQEKRWMTCLCWVVSKQQKDGEPQILTPPKLGNMLYVSVLLVEITKRSQRLVEEFKHGLNNKVMLMSVVRIWKLELFLQCLRRSHHGTTSDPWLMFAERKESPVATNVIQITMDTTFC